MLILAFLVIASVCFSVVLLLLKPTPAAEQVTARLAAVRCVREEAEKQTDEELETTVRRGVEGRLLETRLGRRMHDLLLQSRSGRSMSAFLSISAAIACVAGTLAGLAGGGPVAAIGVLVGASAYPVLLGMRRTRRVERFAQQLPAAATMMARALRAGHSVPQMLELAADQSKNPLREDFAQLSREQRLGVPLRDAVLALSRRVPLPDLRFLVSAILIQKETGGDLIQILERTAALIEERLRIRGQIQTFTAQGRMSAWVLTALPVALLILLSVALPGYAATLFHEPAGQHMLLAGFVLLVLGGLVIRRIVNVKV